jgi:cobalt-zinc-cadmium resistance protein CzcA
MIERIVRASVTNARLVIGLTLIAALFAGIGARSLRFDALPDVTTEQVVILTSAPGLTPEEVERLVTRPVEAVIGGLPGLVEQRSVSRYGIGSVTAVFHDGTDLLRARQLVSERLATLGDLPAGVEAPELGPLSGGLGEVFHFTVSSDRRTPAELYEIVQLRIAPLLRRAPGIVEVNTWGGERRTLDVVGDPMRMAHRHVTLADLRDATLAASGNAPGASLPAGSAQALLRGVAWPQRASDLASAVVRVDDDDPMRTIRIADVASVVEGALPRIGGAAADGRGETVYVLAQMLTGANALEVLEGVHVQMAEVARVIPEDVRIEVFYDRSDLVERTLGTVERNLLEGGALVIFVLFVMLGSMRAGVLVASVIPLSMLGAVLGMIALDIPGNLMSLGALDFGLLVDGAVVMVESVFHEVHARKAQLAARALGAEVAPVASGVARPVFYSVLIILLVYVPILSLRGVEGRMFRPMAWTVVLALASSLVLSLTFVPAAASLLLRPKDVPDREPLAVRLAERAYAPVLRAATRAPFVVIVLAVVMLAAGIGLFFQAGNDFMPRLDEGSMVVESVRAPDISLDTAIEEASRSQASVLARVPEVRRAVNRIGSAAVALDLMGLEQSDMYLHLAPRDEWRPGMTRDRLITEIGDAYRAASGGAEISFTQPIEMRFNELVGGASTDVTLSIFGEDLGDLRRFAEQSAHAVQQIEGAEDVRILAPADVSLVEVRPRPLEAAALGFSARDVLDVVSSLRTGLPAGTTYDGPIAIPIRVLLGDHVTAFTADDAPVPTTGGAVLPLSRLATVERVEAPCLVNHFDAARRIVVGFNVRGRDLGAVVQEAQADVEALGLPRGYRTVWGGQYESFESARARLSIVIPVVMITILALLLFLFGGLRPALTIFLNVPFAAVGGIFALALRDLPVSISAAIGFIALSGIAVLNGVVLVTRITALEAEGKAPADAARLAAESRLRPVLMTALVAALGFVPMMLATGAGAEVQRPLATVVVGGLVTSTILTLVILPSIYPWIERLGRWRTVSE